MEGSVKLRKFISTAIRECLNEDVNNDTVVFHGTNSRFNVFDDTKPIFFTDNINVAKTYGNIVVKAKLNIENPIELDFNNRSTYFFVDKWYLPSDLAIKIKKISEDLKNRYILDDEIQEELECLQFSDMYGDLDGIIMKDINDSFDIFSTLTPTTNYVVFDKKQIHVV